MDLHYSQTRNPIAHKKSRFTTLWIYTTLKRFFICEFETVGFTTLWIYTTLKLKPCQSTLLRCFTTLWIYTTLKPRLRSVGACYCFTTLWIYTTLKPKQSLFHLFHCFTTLWIYTTLKLMTKKELENKVLLPYGFTLLSNLKFQSTFFAFRQQISGIQESKRRHYIASGNHKAALLYHYFFVSATISHKSLSITETFSSGSL